MTITSSPQDKFAFLFSGPALPEALTDLQNVFNALTQSYNYPASQITIVLGEMPSTMPSFPGAAAPVIITGLADFQNALSTFAGAASGPASIAGLQKTAVLYFTGGGQSVSGSARLLLDATGTATIDAAGLKPQLNAFTNCHVNVVMQQSHAGGFVSALTGSTLAQWSFTAGVGAAETSLSTPAQGNTFTYGWTRGLNYETLPADAATPGAFGDQLGAGPAVTDTLLSLFEAKEFGTQIVNVEGVPATPFYQEFGGEQFLGAPEFLIRDGSPFYESPDVFLTHPAALGVPDGDLYVPDTSTTPPFNNTVNVRVRNVGTHPVRRYSLGLELFKSGSGPMNDTTQINNRTPAGGLLPPIPVAAIGAAGDAFDTATWEIAFATGVTHSCVTAEAKFVSTDVDFSWDIIPRDFEAQRNLDPMPMAPPPAPEGAQLAPIKGMKEHEYGIHNRFNTPRRHAVVFPPDFAELTQGLELAWFERTNDKAELTPLRPVDDQGLLFDLGPFQTRNLVLRARFKRGANVAGEIRLPFTIVVETDDDRPNVRVAARRRGFAEVAGFTVVISQKAATLRGTVVDREGRPAAKARVILETVDRRNAAVVTTDAQGRYELADINPDVFRIRTQAGQWRSQEQIVPLLADTSRRVDLALTEPAAVGPTRLKVVLDRVRVLNDHDPLCKGKGELVFQSVVIPDFDEGAKQVTRLPVKGAYKVGDKPGQNELELGVTVFDGVVSNDALAITIGGQELDLFDPDDELKRYERTFAGKPETWVGSYRPGDEAVDRENVGDWALWYRIERG